MSSGRERSRSNIRSAAVGYLHQGTPGGAELGGNRFELAVGRWIAAERVAKKIEQAEIARQAGVSQPVWSRLERGLAPWSLERFVVACTAIGAPAWEVLRSVLGELQAPKGEAELRRATRDLFPDEPAKSSSGKRQPKGARADPDVRAAFAVMLDDAGLFPPAKRKRAKRS
jgi:transcriptional regulator with XRE-family HTH domain